MSQLNSPDSRGAPRGSPQSARVPITARLLMRDSLSARRAAAIIAAFTLIITVVGGILERALDHQEYSSIGKGLWFALQTVTTVGYGDLAPSRSVGRIIASVLMLTAIGFLAVITAAVTAALVESNRRQLAAGSDTDVERRIEEVNERLGRIEAALGSVPSRR